jgi:hypothetical protein
MSCSMWFSRRRNSSKIPSGPKLMNRFSKMVHTSGLLPLAVPQTGFRAVVSRGGFSAGHHPVEPSTPIGNVESSPVHELQSRLSMRGNSLSMADCARYQSSSS